MCPLQAFHLQTTSNTKMSEHCYMRLQILGLSQKEMTSLREAIEKDCLLDYCLLEPNWLETPDGKGGLAVIKGAYGSLRRLDGGKDYRSLVWRDTHWGTHWTKLDGKIACKDDTLECELYSGYTPPFEAIKHLSAKLEAAVVRLTYRQDNKGCAGVLVARDSMSREIHMPTAHLMDCYQLDPLKESSSSDDLALDDDDYYQIWIEQKEIIIDQILDKVAATMRDDLDAGIFDWREGARFNPHLEEAIDKHILDAMVSTSSCKIHEELFRKQCGNRSVLQASPKLKRVAKQVYAKA